MSNLIKSETIAPKVGRHDKVVLFDGVCVLCSAWVDFLLKHDKRGVFKITSVQSPEGQAILAHFNQPLMDFKTMYLLEDDKLYLHSTAFIRVVSRLGLPWMLVSVVWLIPRGLRDFLYRLIANNRYRLFGKRETCRMPDEEHRSRFL